MSVDNFIPQKWSGSILKNLNDSHVFAQGFNRDYQGEIKQSGDTVRINSIGRVTVKSYTKNSDIDNPEVMDDSQQILLIDQADYFNVYLDDVDKVQSNVALMGAFSTEASWGIADEADKYLAEVLDVNTAPENIITAASVGTGAGDDDMYELLVDLRVKLDTQNVPSTGRWVVMGPAHHGLLLKDPRFVSFGTDKNRANLRGEPVGTAAGFTIRISNLLRGTGGIRIQAGHSIGCSYAEQIMKVETFRPERRFGDAIKGLHVYGAKVTRPYALARVDATVV